MLCFPSAARGLFMSFCVAFSEPTFRRMACLAFGAILASGRHTVTAMLWSARCVISGHWSDYHRVFCRASWSLWELGKILARAILQWVPDDEPVVVAIDDTTAQHRGKRVYGKGRHRDGVLSTHSHMAFKWGHCWVVLGVLVKFPFARRRWALPVLMALYRPEDLDRQEHRRHKTPPDLARQLIAVLIRWFPSRRFVFLGDGGYASHELARSCQRHARRSTLVSRFHPKARLYEPPPKRRPGQKGRTRVVGRKLPTPERTVAKSRRHKAIIEWTGGRRRRVELVSGAGHWYKAGRGLVEVRWVFVHDLEGNHRDEYYVATDVDLTAEQIAGYYTRRWSIETTFEEVREHLGFETTRQRSKKSVLRTGPWLLGLFSVVCLVFANHARTHKVRMGQRPWYKKAEPTFSDALTTVRQLIWRETLFQQARETRAVKKLPPALQEMLLHHLAAAA